MRLFTALQPSPGFRAALEDLQARLQGAGVTGKYRDPDGLHLTLAFIGEWPEDAEDVTDVLPPVPAPFSITLSHLGVFPDADVLWAGVDPCEALAANTRHCLADAGIPFDRKRFFPHITLARKPDIPHTVILSDIAVPRVSMIVDTVCLYRSDRGKNGMAYTVIGQK